MTPNSCNLKCVESIESSPALSLRHNVSPKRLQGVFFPPWRENEGERRRKKRKERRKKTADICRGGISAIKVLFWDTFSLLYGVLHPSLAVAKI